jgi:hypothetical protein
MPTIIIEICRSCGKKTCDGGIWRMISCIRKNNKIEDIKSVHPDNLIGCTLNWSGVKHRKNMTGKQVGDLYTRSYDNWVKPSIVTLEKVEM